MLDLQLADMPLDSITAQHTISYSIHLVTVYFSDSKLQCLDSITPQSTDNVDER